MQRHIYNLVKHLRESFFAREVNTKKPLIIFPKSSIADVRLGPSYNSVYTFNINNENVPIWSLFYGLSTFSKTVGVCPQSFKKELFFRRSLREKCPDTGFFLVHIFLYSVQIHTRKYGPEKNSVFGHFSRSGTLASYFLNPA